MALSPLAPCPACARHVRSNALRCPFCDRVLEAGSLDVAPDLDGQRLKRAALFAFATTMAAVSCNSPQRPDPGNIVQPYEAPPTPRPPPVDAGAQEPVAVVAIYGAPMPMLDASPEPPSVPDGGLDGQPGDARTNVRDAARRSRSPNVPVLNQVGPVMVRYGAPPPPEAGV